MKRIFKKLIKKVGRRGAFLLFLAVLDLIYAYGLLAAGSAVYSTTLIFVASVMPLATWALLWALVGVVCLTFAFKKKDAPAFAAAIFIKSLWALTFLLGWIFADIERAYLTTVIWGGFAAITWLIATWPDPYRLEEE